jgi:hypothetical protein
MHIKNDFLLKEKQHIAKNINKMPKKKVAPMHIK